MVFVRAMGPSRALILGRVHTSPLYSWGSGGSKDVSLLLWSRRERLLLIGQADRYAEGAKLLGPENVFTVSREDWLSAISDTRKGWLQLVLPDNQLEEALHSLSEVEIPR